MREITREHYRNYAEAWLRIWPTVGEVTTGSIEMYTQRRLRGILGKTLAKELSALRGLLRWAVASGHLRELPEFPRVSFSQGTKSRQKGRVRATEYTPEEIWAVIAALPERAPRLGIPIRARALVSYVTTLRPSTIARLSVPEHYAPGSSVIRVTANIDKEGLEREVPLSPLARETLDAVCPKRGVIFGEHDLDRYWHAAARKALPAHKAAVFTAQHLRSAGITHALERSSNLAGVQYLAGHTHAATTSKYVRASFRAALEVVSDWDHRGTVAGDRPTRRSKSSKKAG